MRWQTRNDFAGDDFAELGLRKMIAGKMILNCAASRPGNELWALFDYEG
jgi:hypothetical protein